jgi:hypothetical protein
VFRVDCRQRGSKSLREINFRIAHDSGETGKRGIADRFRYADFALPIWQVARANWIVRGNAQIPR